jgi:replication factor C small subunit
LLEIVNSLWVEKYRPKKIKDLVLPESYTTNFEIYIKNQDIPHLLLQGQAGSGKTCLAQILTSKEGIIQNRNDNVLEINGSSQESRGIGYVEKVIEPFLKIPSAKPDKFKIVFIDEADQLTDAAFKSLRNIFEKYSLTSRFILTCNYVSKIETAIQSRCQEYVFKQMSVDFVLKYCTDILTNEKITYDEKDVKFIINGLYPDIRRIVGKLQQCSLTGKLIVDRNSVLSYEKSITSSIVEIINFIQTNQDHKINGVVNNMVKMLGELDLDFRTIYSDLFFRDKIPTVAKVIINKKANEHADCLLPHMHFMACVFEIIQALQKYKQLVGKTNA